MQRLANALPTHSRYKAALIRDPEWAKAYMDAFGDDEEQASKHQVVTAEGWTRETDTLASVVDLLQSIRSVLIGANSKHGRGPTVHPMKRPETALDKARRRAEIDRHKARVSELLPSS